MLRLDVNNVFVDCFFCLFITSFLSSDWIVTTVDFRLVSHLLTKMSLESLYLSLSHICYLNFCVIFV